MASPPSPAARRLGTPSWLDTRFVVGLLLVLVSVVVGSRVLAAADRSDRVYAVTRDLAAGVTLTGPDLRVVRVRLLDGSSGYVSADGPKPVGYTLGRAVGASELLPRQALAAGTAPDVRLVTVPVASNHYPAGLARGNLIDLYLTAKPRPGAPAAAPVLVLRQVLVEGMSAAGGGRLATTADAGIVLKVPAPQVSRVVAAAQGGDLDAVRIPAASPLAPSPATTP